MKVKVFITEFCLTLCDSVDYNLPSSSVHGISQAKILEWVAIPFSRGSSWLNQIQGLNPGLLHWQTDYLPLCHPGSPHSP